MHTVSKRNADSFSPVKCTNLKLHQVVNSTKVMEKKQKPITSYNKEPIVCIK